MVKAVETDNSPGANARSAERALVLGYAPHAARDALAALFALDETLGNIVRTTREPLIGQMRLTWWYEALAKLDAAAPPAEPVLQALYAHVIVAGVSGRNLAAMTDGWEVLLDAELDVKTIERYAAERGGQLFVAAARILDVEHLPVDLAGRGWALADLSLRLNHPENRTVARKRAVELLDQAVGGRWPTAARALGAMAILARYDVSAAPPPPGGPKRVGRVLLHRLTGY